MLGNKEKLLQLRFLFNKTKFNFTFPKCSIFSEFGWFAFITTKQRNTGEKNTGNTGGEKVKIKKKPQPEPHDYVFVVKEIALENKKYPIMKADTVTKPKS